LARWRFPAPLIEWAGKAASGLRSIFRVNPMAEIFPFAAYRYDPALVELEKVVTQPYDKITPEMQQRYESLSPYNLVPVEKGRSLPGDAPGRNAYTRAAETLEQWIAGRILARDPSPGFYVYSQDYAVPGSGERRVRRGFIGLGRLEDYSSGVVFRHEQTHAAPKADRLELLRHTRAQTGLLLMLYSDAGRGIDARLAEATEAPPDAVVRDEFGVIHRLWRVAEDALVRELVSLMADQKLIIADGHHRYETALAYRDERRAAAAGKIDPCAPYEKAMMAFFNTYSGLTILPTHRLVRGLAEFRFEAFRKQLAAYFDWYAYPFSGAEERARSLAEFRKDLAGRGRGRNTLGLYPGGGAFYLFLLRRDASLASLLPDVPPIVRQLDVVLLHRIILEKILGIAPEAVRAGQFVGYEREMEAALAGVDDGRAQVACLLNPVRIEQVREIALAGEVLPQKSTDFYPKLLSGLCLYPLDG
jgi:uncharacterized protein (DUF1015 family)